MRPGSRGGESETIIGRWLRARPAMRERVLLFTKVGSDLGEPCKKGLSAKWIAQAAEDSLARLGTDRIDVYFSHWHDSSTPYEETLRAYARLLQAGKVRAIGASDRKSTQLAHSLAVARREGLPAPQVLQPDTNPTDRPGYEGPLPDPS